MKIFHEVDDPTILLPILKGRLPQSCLVYNQVKMYNNFKEDLTFYTIGKEITVGTWIVVKYSREDYGYYITVSAPSLIIEGKEDIPSNIKEAFLSGGLINWGDGIRFVALEKRISAMIFDISVNIKGNVTEVHPCYLYYLDNDEASKLEIRPHPDAEVRRLLPDSESDFILKTWLYSKEGSDIVIRKNIRGAASAGCFVQGKCVSGVITVGNGLISSLYTLKDYRKRGFAKLTMKYVFKECAADGCIPCLTVEVTNDISIAFYKSMNVKQASIVDWIDIKKLDVDVA